MRRTAIISSIITAALLAACAAWPVSLAAEPISPGDIATPGATSATPQPPQEIKDAAALFNKRDYEGTLKLLKESTKKNPDLGSPYFIMFQFFAQTNNAAGARNALELAVKETPNDPEAYAVMGEIAIRERRITEARMLYDKANSLMSTWTAGDKRKNSLQQGIYSGLATTDQARADWPAAQKELEAWLKLDPANTVALQRLAECLFQQDHVQEAFDKFKEAAKLDPKILTPEALIARLYWQANKHDKAKKWVIDALNAAPKDFNTRLFAAQWAFESGQVDVAKKQVELALTLPPNSNLPRAKMLCGVVALFQKDYKKAEEYFESVFTNSPKETGASNNLALALIEQKDDAKKQKALELAEVNVRQYPESAEAYSTYGWVLYRLNRLDDAEKVLNKSISLSRGNLNNAETAYYLARVFLDRGGRDADAKQLLELATKTTVPFAQREEAKELLEKLGKAAKPAEKPAK
jgi:tetratricopeptide (TPR) repeat protein